MRRRDDQTIRPRRVPLVALLAVAALLVGCGSGSSTSSSSSKASASSATTTGGKPSYCAAVSDLEKSVKAVPTTDLVKNGTSGLKSEVAQAQKDAAAVVNEAKSNLAAQTSALKSSVDKLLGSVNQLASSPTTSQPAALPAELSAVSTATKNLISSASPKCS